MCALLILSLAILILPTPLLAEAPADNRAAAAGRAEWTEEGKVWYLAEGCTAGGFETWVLLQNPGKRDANVTITYQGVEGLHAGPKLKLPPGSRRSVNVADTCPGWWEVSTKVTSDAPVIAERSMYWGGRTGGNNSMGATSPAHVWYLAEGCTAGGFETWVLLQNPGEKVANVTLTYQGPNGPHPGPNIALPPGSRRSVNVADTCPGWREVSTKISSDAPVIAERSMYWGGRKEGHNSPGVTKPWEEWYLAEGCTGGDFETWVLLQNPGEKVANVTLTYQGPAGPHPGPTLALPPGSRRSVNVAGTCPDRGSVSTKISSDAPVIAERSMYWGGRTGGSNSVGHQRDETVIPGTTKVLDRATLGELESVSSGGKVLTFKKSTGQLDSVSKGDVLVCGVTDRTPYGLLRKATSKKAQGGKVIVGTEDASLEEAVKRGTLTVEKKLTSADLVSASALVEGVRIDNKGKSGSGLKFTISKDINLGGAKLSGDITFEQEFDLNGHIDFNPMRPWEPPRLQEMNLTTTTKEETNLKLSGEIPIEVKAEKEIVRYYFAPIIVPAPPVVLVPTITVKLGAKGRVTANMEAKVAQKGEFTAGLSYAGGLWTPISGYKSDFSYECPTLSPTSASVKAYVKPQLSLMLYTIVGPYVGIEGYLALDAEPAADPWWTLYGGVKGDVGVELRVFSKVLASYSKTVFDWKEIIAQAKSEKETTGKVYWDGTEFIPINSGFTSDGGTSRSKVAAPNGYLYLFANSWYMSRCQIAWSTDSAVDLSGYDRVCVEWRNTGSNNNYNESYLIAATNSHDRQENQSATSKLTRTGSFERRVDYLDVSNINEPRYIRVHARDGDYWGAGTNSGLYVYKIWLEPTKTATK